MSESGNAAAQRTTTMGGKVIGVFPKAGPPAGGAGPEKKNPRRSGGWVTRG